MAYQPCYTNTSPLLVLKISTPNALIMHLAELDIDIVSGDQHTGNEAKALETWLS